MEKERQHLMKRSPKPASGQFTLALHREPGPPLDQPRKAELLQALADLLREALGVESPQNQSEREERDERKDHA